MSRKVDSSAGAGLNGEGMGDVEEVSGAVGFAGGLPELFLGLGILGTPLWRTIPGKVTGLLMTGSSRPPERRHNPKKKYASAKRASPTPARTTTSMSGSRWRIQSQEGAPASSPELS